MNIPLIMDIPKLQYDRVPVDLIGSDTSAPIL